jgi:two-component system nitrogen regulation response regulator GlnG
LIVDDEPNLLYSLKKALHSDALHVITADTAGQGIRRVRTERPDAVILDVRLPDMPGLDAFNLIRQIDPRLPVIIVTAFTTAETAIEAMKRGAYEYLLKPVDLDRLGEVVARALDVSRMSHVPAMFADEEDSGAAGDVIVGHSAGMQEVYKAIGRVAAQDVTVLIEGESGTGKEMIARAIFHHSRRSTGPFLAINCAAIPEMLLESELFGHESGAFTGAERQRIGKFEQVHGGTLFLDEIGDMPLATQAKVLRLLQEGSFQRVGSNKTIHSDVRIIAATNQDLESMVRAGAFRRDLYYRLKVFSIRLPSLRERLDDLPLLLDHFIKRYARELSKNVRSVSAEALDVLKAHLWPGNVRELQSCVKYALVHTVGELVTPECLPPSCLHAVRQAASGNVAAGNGDPLLPGVQRLTREILERGDVEVYRLVHSEVDRILLEQVLNHVGGNQAQAASVLGISRTTLRARIAELGLVPQKRFRVE